MEILGKNTWFLATSPFTEHAEPVPQGFLIIIEGGGEV